MRLKSWIRIRICVFIKVIIQRLYRLIIEPWEEGAVDAHSEGLEATNGALEVL